MKSVEKHYHVFISSTYVDLKVERDAVIQLLYRTNFIPRGMELFPNGKPDVWELIKELIDECDLYMLITAGRYGSIPSDAEKSFTEREYDYAIEKNKPVLIYQHKEPRLHNPDSSADEVSSKKEKLQKFQARINSRTSRFWGNISELEKDILLDLREQGAKLEGGWTKQRQGMTDRLTSELRLLEEKFESKEVKELTKTIQNALKDFKFGRTKDRVHDIGVLVPYLNDQEWSILTRLASAQAQIRGMHGNSDERHLLKPMYDSIVDMVSHYEQQLKNFEDRIFEVDGKLFDDVSKHFVLAVEQEFLALSNDDFVFWDEETSKDYYEYNLQLIEKGVVIKRIFAIPYEKFNDIKVHSSILRQIRDKIQVGIISTDQLKAFVMGNTEHDFAIHDDFAVSFFRPFRHRIYKVITQDRDIKHYRDLHYRVANGAQDVPGKTGENRKWFQNEEEFKLWSKKSN